MGPLLTNIFYANWTAKSLSVTPFFTVLLKLTKKESLAKIGNLCQGLTKYIIYPMITCGTCIKQIIFFADSVATSAYCISLHLLAKIITKLFNLAEIVEKKRLAKIENPHKSLAKKYSLA